MTEAPTAKFRLPRKAIRVTYPDCTLGTFDSVKAASDATGHSHGLLMRLAATGEADVNGDTYALVDYVPKKTKAVSVAFEEEWYADLITAAETVGKKPGEYIRGVVQDHLKLV